MEVRLVLSIFTLLTLFNSCAKKSNPSSLKFNDDYVLVEFAAKLEEDFHKINKVPTDTNENINNLHP